MMKVLITGYSGFVGSHLLDELKANFNIKLLGRAPPKIDCEFLKTSINDSTDFSAILDDLDVVIHVAARAHIMNDISNDPLDEFRAVNVRGTINLAKQAAQNGVKRFIFISSIKVNGEQTSFEMPFTYADKRKPEDAYGLSKSEAEEQLVALSQQTGMEYVFIRPPLVYGKGSKANFSALMKLIVKKVPLPFGAVNGNVRSLVSVYNLIDLIKVCIEHPNASNQTFLVSDGDDLSTNEMVKLMAKVQGVNLWLLPIPVWMLKLLGKLTGKSDIISRLTDSLQVDITHTREALGWAPPYSVEEGFAMCVQKSPDNVDEIVK
jgi:nucleoside-diphosphate-sugar epimerase